MQRVSPRGALVTQAGSPVFARQAFWSVHRTLAETANPAAPGEGLEVAPYHTYVPSFGDWGFVLASLAPLAEPGPLPDGLRYFAPELWPAMTVFPPDSGPVKAEPNSILSHRLVRYYERGWAEWMN